jgi:hypothetical protein
MKIIYFFTFSLIVVSFQTTIYFGMGEVLNIFSSLIIMGRILSMLPAITCYQESSVLRTKLLEHGNLVKYAEKLKMEFIEAGSSSSSASYFQSDPPSSASRRGPSNSSKMIFNSRLVSFFFSFFVFSFKICIIFFFWGWVKCLISPDYIFIFIW